MQPHRFTRLSLKTKMALAVSALFLLFVTTASWLVLAYFERAFKESLSTQQFSLVMCLANNIDDKLRIAQNALIAVAATAPEDAFVDPERAQDFLDHNVGLLAIFDNGIFFIDKHGRLMVESPFRPNRRGKDLWFREWVQKTVTGRQPYISDPYISTHTPGQPAVVFTVPIFDHQGELTGMMTGSLDLLGKNFLAMLSETRIGNTGYLFLTDSNRIMIAHPDKDRILKPATAPGANPLYERALAGFEGSGEVINSEGIPVLSSYKRLRTTSWILGCSYRTTEAYAPLYRVKQYFIVAALAMTALFLFATWQIMRRLLAPMQTVIQHMESLPQKSGPHRLIPYSGRDEIGVLTTTFNTMLDTLDRQQAALNEQARNIENERAFLQALMDAIPDLIFCKDRNSIYRNCNAAFATGYVGLSKEQILGRSDYDFELTAEQAEFFQLSDRRVMQKEIPERHDVMIRLVDGRQILVETVKVPFHDAEGNIAGIIGVSRDITERKETEAKLREQALALAREIAERQFMQEALTYKQRQLEELNNSLEERIRTALKDLRLKDQLMITQNRQAAMGEMIGNIAHQWRQPLNALGLLLANIEDAYRFNELDEAFVQQAVADGTRLVQKMSTTISDFSNFFRPDKEIVPFSALQHIRETIALVESSFQSARIAIRLNAPCDVTLIGLPNEYSQVLLNLLSNAREAITASGQTAGAIDIRLREEGGRGYVTLSDNGGGIQPELLDKIFEPYFSTKPLGTGIGLYMSKMIIERNMDGRLSVCNIAGGAEFRIEVRAVGSAPAAD